MNKRKRVALAKHRKREPKRKRNTQEVAKAYSGGSSNIPWWTVAQGGLPGLGRRH